MSRRSLASLLASTLLGAFCGCGEPRQDKLNVVIVSLDTLRADALGTYGEARPTSPTFDRFAAQSVVFDECYSQAPMTAPSHMTLFTSLYPSVHRVVNLMGEAIRAKAQAGEESVQWRVDPAVTTLAEVFRAGGWRTAAFHGGGNLTQSLGFDQGFEWYDGKPKNGMNANAERLFDFAQSEAWLDAHADEPFFLFLHTYLPHAPYAPPPPWDRAFDPDYAGPIPYRDAYVRAMSRGEPGPPAPGPDASPARQRMAKHTPWQFWGYVDPDDPRELEHLKALYAGDVRTTDDALATMLAALERRGLTERTLVIVLSDHGEGFGERGYFEHPGKLHHELVHVPLAVRGPGLAPRRVDSPVGLIDVAPTVCELAGLPAPREMQGRSLAGLLRGGEEPTREVWSEFVWRWRNGPKGPEPLDFVRARRDERFTVIATKKGDVATVELFDRTNDPKERNDLGALPEHAARLETFVTELAAHEAACAAVRFHWQTLPMGELEEGAFDELRKLGYAR